MILHNLFNYVDFTSCLLAVFVFLLIADFIRNKNPPNFPPGPRPLPFVGNIFTGLDFKSVDKVKYLCYIFNFAVFFV